MYAPNYPFASQPPNPNATSQQLTPQQQAYLQQQQAHRQSQSPHISQQQHMMFNQQGAQYAGAQAGMAYGAGMGAGINTGGAQSQMQQQGNPSMGMGMQNAAGMAHPAGAQAGMAGTPTPPIPSYQTPYTASPYGSSAPPAIPTVSAPTSNPNQGQFLPPTTSASQFSTPQRMSASPMNPALQQQARNSPFATSGQRQHSTPPQNQGQFQTPGHSAQNSMSMPSPAMMAQAQAQQQAQGMAQHMQNQQAQGGQSGGQTPITPSSAGGQGQTQGQNQSQNNAPLSPRGEAREKERVGLLLEINRVLLMEVMKLQGAQAEAKAEKEAAEAKEGGEKPKLPIDPQMGKEFVECMRRIQYNLSYLAAIADRSHKPSSQTPPHPAIISAPQLLSIKNLKAAKKADAKEEETKTEGQVKSEDEKNEEEEEEDGPKELQKMYAQLQTLFPGVDPKKEPPVPVQGQQKPAQPQGQGQQPPISGPGGVNTSIAQQKLATGMSQPPVSSPAMPTLNASAPSHGTPAGPGATGFGSGGNASNTFGMPISMPPGGMASLTLEQRASMMQSSVQQQQQQQRQAQMAHNPNRDFSAAGANMGFGSGAGGGGGMNPNHIGMGRGSMGAGPGGGGLPGQSAISATSVPSARMGQGGSGGGGIGAGMSMASNENRARMMAQMQQQMQGMTAQQRIEIMQKYGMSREAMSAIGGSHLRGQGQGQNMGGIAGQGGQIGGQGQQGGMSGMYRQ